MQTSVLDERYSDFSEDDSLLDNWRAGEADPRWIQVLCEEIQEGLGRRNPVTSLRQLVASGVASQTFMLKTIQRFLWVGCALLAINVGLLATLVYLQAQH